MSNEETDTGTQLYTDETVEESESQSGEESAEGSEVDEQSSESEESSESKEDESKEGQEEKSDEGEPEAKAPEQYELKLTEDSHLDKAVVDEIAEFAKKQGLSNEAAQEILDRESNAVKSFADNQLAEHETKIEGWKAQLEKDPEYGGDSLKENAELAKRALAEFAPEGFGEVLNTTGLGNHPDLFKTFVRIGKLMAEDKFIAGNTPTTEPKSMEETFYGNTPS